VSSVNVQGSCILSSVVQGSCSVSSVNVQRSCSLCPRLYKGPVVCLQLMYKGLVVCVFGYCTRVLSYVFS
jgi:hypothetical protein